MKVTEAQVKRADYVYFRDHEATRHNLNTMRAVLEDYEARREMPGFMFEEFADIAEVEMEQSDTAPERELPPLFEIATACEAAGRDDRLATGQLYLDAATWLRRYFFDCPPHDDTAMLERAFEAVTSGAVGASGKTMHQYIQLILEHTLQRKLVLK